VSKEEEPTPEQQRRKKMDELFDPEMYTKNSFDQPGGNGKEFFFADGSDALANKNFIIMVTHVPSNKSIKFKAFITAFNDTFSQDWNSETVYGRADPLYNFKQTTRRISIGFKMPAASEGEAYENLVKAQQFAQFMYPNYSNFGTTENPVRTISQGPLLRLKVMNLLQTTATKASKGDQPSGKTLYESYGTGGKGMLGFCSDVTFNFNLEGEHGAFQKSDGTILPKLIEVSIGGFSPIHEHHLGWDEDIFGEGSQFPYGAAGADEDSAPLGISYSALEKKKDEKARAEAAIANAEARYGGMFGNARRKRDDRRKDKYSDSKRAYVDSALAGAAAIDAAETQQVYDEVMGAEDADYRGGTYDPVDYVEF